MLGTSFSNWLSNTTAFWDNVGWFLAGLGTVIGFIWHQHRKQIKNVVHEELADGIDNDVIKKIAKAVDEIRHETRHNGGSSMKDAIARVEQKQSEGFEKIDEQIERMERYIQKLDRAIERHLGYHEGHDE